MSAFLCDDNQVSAIVGFIGRSPDYRLMLSGQLSHGKVLPWDYAICQKIGVRMRAMNVSALEARYGKESPENTPPAFAYRLNLVSTMQAYKWLNCFLHQCAEGNVPDCKLYRTLRAIEGRIAGDIVRDLPAYEAAEW